VDVAHHGDAGEARFVFAFDDPFSFFPFQATLILEYVRRSGRQGAGGDDAAERHQPRSLIHRVLVVTASRRFRGSRAAICWYPRVARAPGAAPP